MTEPFQTRALTEDVEAIAPDQSEIRFLVQVQRGSMVHCCLPVGAISLAVTHRTVEEVWYVLSGQGELWRQQGEQEVVTLRAGISLSIPLGTHFQSQYGKGSLAVHHCHDAPLAWGR